MPVQDHFRGATKMAPARLARIGGVLRDDELSTLDAGLITQDYRPWPAPPESAVPLDVSAGRNEHGR
jgi:hypothetical protein